MLSRGRRRSGISGARSAYRDNAGFSLIELMTAVFIIVILLAVGTPSFTNFIQNMQIRSVAESMQAGLNLARDEAVKRNSRVSLWLVDGLASGCAPSAGGNAWVVSIDDPTGKCDAAPSDSTTPRLLQSRSLGEGSSNVKVMATTGNCATFNGFGRMENLCGSNAPLDSIGFSSRVAPGSTQALAVRVAPGGAVKLCNPEAAASHPNACPAGTNTVRSTTPATPATPPTTPTESPTAITPPMPAATLPPTLVGKS